MHIKNLSFEEIADYISKNNVQAFRAKQIYEWIWKKRCVSFNEMTNIPAPFREKLHSEFLCNAIQSFDEYVSTDGTRKYAFHLSGGNIIESVLIPSLPGDRMHFNTSRLRPCLRVLCHRKPRFYKES